MIPAHFADIMSEVQTAHSRASSQHSGRNQRPQPPEPERAEALHETDESDIMVLLGREKMLEVKRDFMKLGKDEGLEKNVFISLMLYHLPPKYQNPKVIENLNEMFDQIDVNGDGHLEWSEFTNHIIEQGMVRQDRAFIDAIKNYNPSEWKDESKHEGEIEHIHYVPKTKHLLVMDKDSKYFKVYNTRNGKFIQKVSGHRGAVISATDAPEKNFIATCSNDLTISLWDDTTYALKQRIPTPDMPLVLSWCWFGTTGVLYSSGTDGMIYEWDLDTFKEISNIGMLNPFSKNRKKEAGHSSPVSALLPIPKLNILVSADLGGKMILWDMPTNKRKSTMEPLNKGIYSLDWSPDVSSLYSAGLEHDAFVWNPYVRKHIFKLKGHIHSLIGIRCIPNSYQVITADIASMFKIWDIRTLSCVQTFNAPCSQLNSFVATYPEKRIYAGFRFLHQFTYDEPRDQHLADEGIAVAAIYNELFNTFITAHPHTIKIWDATNGQLVQVFRDAVKEDAEITAISLDSRQRKLYLGNSKGRVVSINVKNGARIKKFAKHRDEVTCIEYWEEEKQLFSASRDKRILIHDDSKAEDDPVTRNESIKHRAGVNCLAMSRNKLLASCSDDGTVILTSMETFRQDAVLQKETRQGESATEVKSILFLSPENCLVSADLSGHINFWHISNSKLKNTLVLTKENVVMTAASTADFCAVTYMIFDEREEKLFCGDENGNVRRWRVASLMEKLRSTRADVRHESEDGLARAAKASSTFLTNVSLGVAGRNLREMLPIDDSDVVMEREWVAHKDGITHMNRIARPPMLITSSFDCNVNIWSYDGERLGSLVLGNDPHWSVRPDNSQRDELRRRELQNISEQIHSRVYDEIVTRLKAKDEEEVFDAFMTGSMQDFSDEEEEEGEEKRNAFKMQTSDMPDPVERIRQKLGISHVPAEDTRPSFPQSTMREKPVTEHLRTQARSSLQQAALSIMTSSK